MSSSKGVALVTGSAQGIGKEIALRLADDGFDIAINDIPSKKDNLASLAEEIRGKGRKVFEAVADVSVDDQVKGMVENTVKELGGLDVVSLVLHHGEHTSTLVVYPDGGERGHVYLETYRGK
jgi:NAD(P)-dependent dehydrogenase (short-subunit alcohol dehydrogenase family)